MRSGRRRLLLATITLLLVSTAAFPLLVGSASKASAAPSQAAVASYAPELNFVQGEKFYPTSVDYVLGTSALVQRTSSGQPVVADPSPTASTLGTHTSSDLYLNNKLTTLDAIASDYASNGQKSGYYAYAHVVTYPDGSSVIQYWLLYAYNNGPLNDHQGDWEVVQVFLDASGNPQQVLLSQHFAGENANWADVEKYQGAHPVVYVAEGSHANYFRAYQGKIGIEDDVVGNSGSTITPDQLQIVMLGDKGNHAADQSWLDFSGRWGYWGTDLEVAQGKAGPLGPVYNQDGVRWAQPEVYLSQTLPVTSYYFDLAFVAANFLLIFIAYTTIRAFWKIIGIARLQRKGALAPGSLFRGRLGLGVAMALIGILLTIAALFLPWYDINSSSQSGPLAAFGNVNLLHLDGIRGLSVNFFEGAGSSDSTSGFSTLLSTQVPFAIILAAGIVLLLLDLVGFSGGSKLGRKFLVGAIASLIPFILIYVLIAQLPTMLPFASLLLPGQNIPPGVDQVLQSVASNPVAGSTTQDFPVVGATSVTWGFGLGAYLFVAAAVLRVVGAGLVWGVKATPPVQPQTAGKP